MRITYGKNVWKRRNICSCKAIKKQLKCQTCKDLKKIAKIFGKKYGLMVNSGSSALTLAMDLINIKKGDEL